MDAAGYSLPVDLWSFGVMTYFLLSGTLPFYAENEELVNLNVQKGTTCCYCQSVNTDTSGLMC